MVYSRFLLTHLADPAGVVAAFHRHICPGGPAIVEDTDFSGHFTYPASPAFRRYSELDYAVVRGRGGDPVIGPRLPSLADGGFEEVDLTIVQPTGTHGAVKLLNPLTMENIADAVIQDGLASREEIGAVIRELLRFAENPRTVASAAHRSSLGWPESVGVKFSRGTPPHAAFAGPGTTKLVAKPTTKTVNEPTRANHGQATGSAKATVDTAASPRAPDQSGGLPDAAGQDPEQEQAEHDARW